MGIIIKQTVKSSFFTYFGAFLGFITTIYLQPRILHNNDQIGLIVILVQYATLFAQFASLGFENIAYRLFPYFRDYQNKHNGFLFLAMACSLIGFLISIIVFFIIKNSLLSSDPKSAVFLAKYIYYLIPLILFTLFFTILDSYYRVLYNSVKGIVLKEFFQRIFFFVPLALYYFRYINFDIFVLLYVISICLPTLIFISSLIKEKQFYLSPNFSFITRDLRNSIISVGLFGLLASFTGLLAAKVDSIMVQQLLNLNALAIYSTTGFFALIITIPYRSLSRISTTVIGDALKENNLKLVADVYYKSCTVQFVIASILFIGIWSNIDNIFRILPASRHFEDGKYVIFFICISNLIDMATGLNSPLITLSKYYRYYTYFTIIFIALIYITNRIFIPLFGITGAAIATALSVLTINVMKYIFIVVKYKMQPYNSKHLLIILISLVSYFSAYFIPFVVNTYIDIFIRSLIIFIVYVTLSLLVKVSEDINQLAFTILDKVGIHSFRKPGIKL